MNKRTRIMLSTPLLAFSLALGPAAAAVWAAAPQALPAAECLVEGKAGDATKVIVTGEGFTKGTKVTVDQTDGVGGVLVTVGEDGKFATGDLPAGKYAAVGGELKATCLGGQAAQDSVNQKAITAAQKAGAIEGWTIGKELAQAGNCDEKPMAKKVPQGLVADAAAQKAAQEAKQKAFDTAFFAAIKRYCTD
ncbi:hypothetical protein ABZZ17_22815 [Streptomyces sp. NPDC006512]|uniref:hypothetical protein n=1 Tax=Streptomyces sp. NPDC006512 TaxID=3154307 RepID=UPI0033B0C65C